MPAVGKITHTGLAVLFGFCISLLYTKPDVAGLRRSLRQSAEAPIGAPTAPPPTHQNLHEVHAGYSQEVLQEIASIRLHSVNTTHNLAFFGIFCTAADFIERELVRGTSNQLAPLGLTMRFVICHPASAELDPVLAAEMALKNDIFLIDCEENMDDGKTPLFFKSVRTAFPNHYFYSKTDLDSYNLYYNVAYALDTAPKCNLYMGQTHDFGGDFNYNVGHMYILSKDLVVLLEGCGDDCADVVGLEDQTIGKFLHRVAGKEKLQWGDWSVRHVAFGADGALKGQGKLFGPLVKDLFTPWLILLHGMKKHNWMEGHGYFREVVTVDAIRTSKRENFVDGFSTTKWDMQC